MKIRRNILITAFLLIFATWAKAQVYNNLATFSTSTTPTHGVKIKTNIPFISGADMSTIFIRGYSYGNSSAINLQLVFYIYKNTSTTYFYLPTISSSGAYTPRVKLANENGKVVVFIDDRIYFQRLWVDAFSTHAPVNYQGWTALDEALNGTNVVEVPYKNNFKGTVFIDGNFGAETALLSVKGNIRAKEIKVEASPWPDYVFEEDYQLPSLKETEQFIKINKHLPEVPSATEVEANGVALGEMNALLLKKVEELTLHLIEKEKQIDTLRKEFNDFKNLMTKEAK